MSEIFPAPSVQEQSPAAFIGMRLSEISISLVAEWCRGHSSSARTTTGDSRSDHALLVHIPPIVGSIGQYVWNPAFEVRREILTQLWGTGAIWHQLDRSARDLMGWLDGLSQLIMQRMQQEVARAARDCDAELAMAAFVRLSQGLRDMTSVILGLYLDRDSDRHQASARQQADANLVFAHELRAPLHTISLSAAILDSPRLGTDVDMRQQQLKIIRSALAHAESLLQHADLLKGSEDAPPSGHATALKTVIESVIGELGARAMAANVRLTLPHAVPSLTVETVVAHLVLSNLVINAIKYADPAKDERWVTVRAEITAGDDPRFITVEVADNGMGIAPSLQQYLFQRGFRVHPQVADGHGLGLAIVRDILGDRGGSIDLISDERIGTAVRFRLPAAPIVPGNMAGRSVTPWRKARARGGSGADAGQRVV